MSGRRDQGTDEKLIRATNRRARHDYVVLETYEAGIMLLGSEVKSLRDNTPTLAEGYARMEDDALWLYGVYIPPLPQASYFNHEAVRRRKLLLHKRELRKIQKALDAKGMTIVPLSLYFRGPRVKVEIGLGQGRRKGDRRSREREKEDRRRIREHY